ncbi:hypothetical protein FA13DRAFT_1718914 [Coprinellus micaceus]|uniref:Uncharacterized protein n=1 Tax=Coprinellus micaceus TaxID=71717 RepID=A0A4Y7SCB4_COPMI|nr:hypothetical protein FA13DRAFT_1718914 [Coprinellus micaceus]
MGTYVGAQIGARGIWLVRGERIAPRCSQCSTSGSISRDVSLGDEMGRFRAFKSKRRGGSQVAANWGGSVTLWGAELGHVLLLLGIQWRGKEIARPGNTPESAKKQSSRSRFPLVFLSGREGKKQESQEEGREGGGGDEGPHRRKKYRAQNTKSKLSRLAVALDEPEIAIEVGPPLLYRLVVSLVIVPSMSNRENRGFSILTVFLQLVTPRNSR